VNDLFKENTEKMPRAKRYYIIGVCMAYNTSLSQTGIFAKIRQRPESMAEHAMWLEEALKTDRHKRDQKWSQAIAAGSQGYINNIKMEIG
jgi:hypothetical protein